METTKLKKLNACREAIIWVKSQKSIPLAWELCERGDWMLWLAKMLDIDDKTLTMAKAMCVKQVEHLMKNQRSKNALQACFDYVNGKITRKELDAAAADAADDADAAYAAYAAYAADAAAAAADAYTYAYAYAADAADAAYAADAADAAYAAADAGARQSAHKACADLIRKRIPLDVIATAIEVSI